MYYQADVQSFVTGQTSWLKIVGGHGAQQKASR